MRTNLPTKPSGPLFCFQLFKPIERISPASFQRPAVMTGERLIVMQPGIEHDFFRQMFLQSPFLFGRSHVVGLR